MAYARINRSEIARHQAAGLTQAETAEKMGISISSVRLYWNRNPEQGRPVRSNPRNDQIRDMAATGKSDAMIAAALGVSVSTVCRVRNKQTGDAATTEHRHRKEADTGA